MSPAIVSFTSEAIDTLKHESHRHNVKIELDYINNLGIDIVVLDRRGIELHIPGKVNMSSKQFEFIAIERFNLQEDVTVKFNENEVDPGVVKYRHNLLDSLNSDLKAQRVTRKAMVQSTLNLAEFRDSGNCVYLKEADIVVYIYKVGVTVLHPSTVSKAIGGVDVDKSSAAGFSFNIKINDPNNKIGNRFVNVCGQVYAIHVLRDSTTMEGAIISSCSDPSIGTVHVPMTLEVFEETVKTYRSYEEATTFGNLAQITKNQSDANLENLRHSNSIAEATLKGDVAKHKLEVEKGKHELEVANSALKQQDLTHKRELELLQVQLDREKHAVELQSLQRKNYYEERSYDRKDSSELIKFLPIIVGAGLVLLFK